MFSVNGISFVGVKSEEEARKMMPEILVEMEMAGYDSTKKPFQCGTDQDEKKPEA